MGRRGRELAKKGTSFRGTSTAPSSQNKGMGSVGTEEEGTTVLLMNALQHRGVWNVTSVS